MVDQPDPPPEDPALAAQRQAADTSRVSAIQSSLGQDTTGLAHIFGSLTSLTGGSPLVSAVSANSAKGIAGNQAQPFFGALDGSGGSLGAGMANAGSFSLGSFSLGSLFGGGDSGGGYSPGQTGGLY